jgi:antitoxin (DNA-binding transcriptional repressor) of toxin-antitoxin stability system
VRGRSPQPAGGTELSGSRQTEPRLAPLDQVTTGSYSEVMKVVGVKVLKAKLSEYLRMVKAGETVLVTERDDVVAELRPAHRQRTGGLSLDDALEAMAERGEATLPSDTFKGWKGFKSKARLRGRSSQLILDSLREDRT